jgi:hypothetical protein
MWTEEWGKIAGERGIMADTRFMIDHMLIKLGKYLRIAGYDAEWDMKLRTHELILRANAEKRVFVTRNTRLPYQYPTPERLVTIKSTDPVAQFQDLIRELGLDPQIALFSKCVRCNKTLQSVADRSAIQGKVHPNVYARYEHFYTCPKCATVFWKGSHVRNTCRKLGVESVDEMGDGTG